MRWALGHRKTVLATALLVFASNFVILPLLGSEFVPETDSATATVIGELPPGTALEASSAAARRWESILLDKAWVPEIQTV